MAKPEKTGPKTNRGQQKDHAVLYPDGTQGTMTQAEWRARDKGAGIRRVDDDESVPDPGEPVPGVPVTETPA